MSANDALKGSLFVFGAKKKKEGQMSVPSPVLASSLDSIIVNEVSIYVSLVVCCGKLI